MKERFEYEIKQIVEKKFVEGETHPETLKRS